MTTLRDILHDVQILTLGAEEEFDKAEKTVRNLRLFQDKLKDILDDAEQRILGLLGIEV